MYLNKLNLGYVDNNLYEKALDLLEEMPFSPDNIILSIALNACRQLNNDRARKIGEKYVQQMSSYFPKDNILMNTALSMLMEFNDIEGGEQLFEQIKNKDIVSYGALIKGIQLYIISILIKLF